MPTRTARVPGSQCRRGTALLLASLAFAAPYVLGDSHTSKQKHAARNKALKDLPITELSTDEAVLHALNRLGFGPRPGEIERVRQTGLANWVDQQLNPDAIDDVALQVRLVDYPSLAMSASQLLDQFPRRKQAANHAGSNAVEPQPPRQERGQRREEREGVPGTSQTSSESRTPAEGMQAAIARGGGAGQVKQGYRGGDDPNNPRLDFENLHTPQRIIAELSMAKMTRAIYSERQLYEEMVDFWFNHFNVFAGKGADRWLVTGYEQGVIRPNAMGKFRDLLYATAKSPAMLFYLDNWLSADPKAFERMRAELAQHRQRFYRMYGMDDPLAMGRFPNNPGRLPQGPGRNGRNLRPGFQKKQRGLNENYARELMELHTLGVDAGYTQQDVIEVAKCFTGWTLRSPRKDPEFHFEDRIHDPGPKIVLGQKIHAGGIKDGEQVLDMLARQPSTAKFISTKLARHFVGDQPPEALVDRMAKAFLDSDGDIRAVLRKMIHSPEFWSRQAYAAKIKKPFELVVSTARALGTDVDLPLPLVMWTGRIGEPLYMCQPPTGYSDKAETWVNSGALLNRLNFSLALATNRIRGAHADVLGLLGRDTAADTKTSLERAIEVLLSNQVSAETRATLEKQVADPQGLEAQLGSPVKQVDLGVVAGLVLGAPEFQRR